MSSYSLFVTMFKAAPHWILRNEWAARWVLRRSLATLHDETECPAFTADSMSADWSKVWSLTQDDDEDWSAQQWRKYAEQAKTWLPESAHAPSGSGSHAT